MFDLMALAYQADVTRVATFYTSREASQLTYPEVGVTEPHHSISHHNDDPAKLAAMALIGVYYSQHVARFVEKLKAMPEGDGTVLDNSMVFFGNGMSNSDMHVHLNLPMIVLGGAVRGRPPRRPSGQADGQPVDDGGVKVRRRAGQLRQQHRAAGDLTMTNPSAPARRERAKRHCSAAALSALLDRGDRLPRQTRAWSTP